MNKNLFAQTPPMGWNSYDYYDTTVTEEQVKENASYMAEHLKPYGWEYIVVDIEWYAYDAGSRRSECQYIPFGKVEMDRWGRTASLSAAFSLLHGGQGLCAAGGICARSGAEIRHPHHARNPKGSRP